MLTEIRDRSSGWFAWVIAALIIIPMAFWGVNEYASTEANPSLAIVGDQKITQTEFQNQFANEQQRARAAMGDNVNSAYLSSDGFKDGVLQRMVNSALITQIAEDNNYRIGDSALAQSIKDSELFQIEGKFDQTAYERYVLSSQFSKARYEDALRADKRLQQVTAGYEESALVLPSEIRALLALQAEKRSFDLVTVALKEYEEGVQLTEEEISEYYSSNQNNFLADEKVSVDYLELNLDNILPTITVDDEELLAVYEQNAEGYISQEKRDTRHILLSTTGGKSESEQLAKANSLVAELAEGKDFAELATANSDDPGSAARGGSLGNVERGQMVAEFEQSAFSLAENEISEPVKSQFGYHVIQVTKIDTPQQQSFEEVKFDLMQEERERRAEELLLEQVDQLRDLAFEQPDNLDAAAEQLGLTVNTTEMFDRASGQGIATSVAVRDAAFSEESLVDESNSEPIEAAEGQYVVLRKASYQASEPKPLESVRADITRQLTLEKARSAATAAGMALLDKARADWPAVSADESLKSASYTIALIDNNREVEPEVLRKVTSMQLSGSEPIVDFVEGRSGDFHLVRLTNIAAGDINSISEQIKDSTRRILAQRNGQSLVSSYLDGLRGSLAPEINSDLL